MIEKEKCVPGTKLVVNNKVLKSNNDHFWNEKHNNGLYAYPEEDRWGNREIPVGTVITILTQPKGTSANVTFKTPDGKEYMSFWSSFKSKVDLAEGVEQPETPDTSEKKRYKIYFNGKPFKTKYFNDLGKVKASLLVSFGYFNQQYEMIQKYIDRNPELEDNAVPEYIGYGNDFKRKDCKNVEIMEFTGKSRTPVKYDFDVTKYYDQSMKLINVTAQFGTAARELYKKTMETGDYSYMLVYIPDEYRNPKNTSNTYYGYFDWNKLKESQRIKDVVKESKVKDTKKCTKHGKTAIVFKNTDDLKQVMLRLETKEYFILDCDGDQLEEKNTRFVKLMMLQKFSDEN